MTIVPRTISITPEGEGIITSKRRAVWVLPLRDTETTCEARLADMELGALLGKHAREQQLPLGILPATTKQRLSALQVKASDAEVVQLTRRLAYASVLVVQGDGVDGLNSLVARPVAAEGNPYTLVLPYQRLFEGTALTKHRAAEDSYLETVASEAWERVLQARGPEAPSSPAGRKKNEYLGHCFHKYKAKFFPRLARALINICADDRIAPVLDPMAGSGTTLLEAALMGIPAIGFDIDPLSAMISNLKARSVRGEGFSLDRLLQSVPGRRSPHGQYGLFETKGGRVTPLPAFISRKISKEAASEIEQEWSVLVGLAQKLHSSKHTAFAKLALSHAVSTKISLRWMGTGDNRFAISVASRSLGEIYSSHLRLLNERLRTLDRLTDAGILGGVPTLATSKADARALPMPAHSVGGVVTSPPYLPAASGRETYLRSRAPALVLLGLLSEADILETERGMLGTILTDGDFDGTTVPREVLDLVRWMQPQRARGPKALPTLNYFQSLKIVLKEIARVLVPGGRCGMVLSARHHFYELTSREIVRSFEMAETVSALATKPKYGVGLQLVDAIEIELPKMDYVARPASKHSYAECLLIFEKPG